MTKEKNAIRKKNSTPIAPSVVEEIKITEDTICVVTFSLSGAFKERQSNASTKDEISKMKMSLFPVKNKKGRFICTGYNVPGRKIKENDPLPKNYYEGPKTYNPYTCHKCVQRRIYDANSLLYLSSTDARPYRLNKKQWDNMNLKERLLAQFTIDAASLNPSNPEFTFEFVN